MVFPPLPRRRFAILYADPGAGALDDLRTLAVDSIAAPDALLFLWATGPQLGQAIELGKAWGFSWATVAFVWDPTEGNPVGRCELCLVFRRGRIPRPRGARNIRQLVCEPQNGDSEKPAEVRRRIEAMFPEHDRIELFARSRHSGWSAWGPGVSPR